MSVVPIMNRSVPDLGEIHAAASVKDLDLGKDDQIEVQQKPDDLPGLMKSRLDELPMWRTIWVFRLSIMYVFILTTMNMLEGWQLGVAGSIVVNRGFLKQFGTTGKEGALALDPIWTGAWAAIINVGQMTSMTFTPYISNRYGRKMSYWASWVLFMACLATLTAAKTPAHWLVGKWFSGMAVGCIQMTTGPYLMEIAPSRIRGALSVFPGLWSGVCGLTCNIMLQVTNRRYPDNYLLPIYVLYGIGGLLFFSILVLPESPWVYGRHNQKEKAFKVLKRLYGNIPGYDYEEEWSIIQRTLIHEKQELERIGASSFTDLFTGLNRRRTLILVGAYFSQIWGGLTMIGTFGTYFFSLAGIEDPFLASLIVSCVGLGNTIMLSFLVDTVGRRRMNNISYTFCSTSLWLIGGLYYVDSNAVGYVLVFLCCVWNCTFGITAAMYGLLSSELPSAQLRVKTVTFCLFTAAGWAIVTCFSVPPLLVALNIRGCFLFGATSLPCVIAFWYFLPETKGRSASEIDELFESGIPAWRWRKYETRIQQRTHEAIVTGEGNNPDEVVKRVLKENV